MDQAHTICLTTLRGTAAGEKIVQTVLGYMKEKQDNNVINILFLHYQDKK